VSSGRRWIALSAVALVVLAACTSDDDGSKPTGATAGRVSTGEPMSLSVFVYNVEYAGDETTDAVIADVDADVVGVLESYNRLPERWPPTPATRTTT
jgi:hypothetical protein